MMEQSNTVTSCFVTQKPQPNATVIRAYAKTQRVACTSRRSFSNSKTHRCMHRQLMPNAVNDGAMQPAAGVSERPVKAHSTTAVQQADPELQQQVVRFQKAYAGRIATHGPRLFRHPDGKLYDTKPASSPPVMAARRKWGQVVQHCRITGGDMEYNRTGKSWRYGIGVSSRDHMVVLSSIGLLPD